MRTKNMPFAQVTENNPQCSIRESENGIMSDAANSTPNILGLCFCNMFAALFGVCGILCAGGDILISCRAVFCRAVKLLDHPERCGFFAFYKAKE